MGQYDAVLFFKVICARMDRAVINPESLFCFFILAMHIFFGTGKGGDVFH